MADPAKRTKKLLRITTIAVVILVVALSMLWITAGPYTSTYPRSFNSDRWKSADAWDNTRCAMLADLRIRVGVVGKSRGELAELLGPDENGIVDQTKSHWHLCPSFMDIFILEVRWEDDRAVEAWVRDT